MHPGVLHHVIIRGIERKAIIKDDADRAKFIERIVSIFADSSTLCFAWTLMTNHTKTAARRKYRQFVGKGIDAGRRSELIGGGLIRSVGGWNVARTRLKGQDRVKGDERILGDGDFVQSVLERCNEDYSRRQRLVAQGVDLKTLSQRVADYLDLSCDRLYAPGQGHLGK